MVRLLLVFLLLLAGCQQTTEPVALDELAANARAGNSQALEQLVAMLGEGGERTNDRVYALLLEIGDVAVPALLSAVSSNDRIQREFAIAALGNFKAKTAVAPIGVVLENPQLGRRYVAAWALGEIGGSAAVPPLVRALADSDEEVRKFATRSLIRLNRQALPPLLEFLRQPQSPVATTAAVRALGDIADPAALEVLLPLLKSPARAEVVTALGKLKDPRSVEALVAVLRDPDWQVRMNAATALGPIGTEQQAPALEKLLEDDVNVVREWAARSLEMMTGRRYTYRNEAGENVQPYNIYH
ncbi:MAG: HEAT repeat domain-containing protein [Deltaproteobacteria bacterium]|nr:HEAT repeat domain-containing protein [Deltaproteobacteria bacterium]